MFTLNSLRSVPVVFTFTACLISTSALAAAGADRPVVDKQPVVKELPERTPSDRIVKERETIRCLSCIDEKGQSPSVKASCDAACAKAGLPR